MPATPVWTERTSRVSNRAIRLWGQWVSCRVLPGIRSASLMPGKAPGLKHSSHLIPEFVAGSDAVQPALHARYDPFALGCQKVQDGVVVSRAQGRPDERQILRRDRERVFVLIPAGRRSQVLSADDESALSIEVSPDVETIKVVQGSRAASQETRGGSCP
jgi:hypothetical protein